MCLHLWLCAQETFSPLLTFPFRWQVNPLVSKFIYSSLQLLHTIFPMFGTCFFAFKMFYPLVLAVIHSTGTAFSISSKGLVNHSKQKYISCYNIHGLPWVSIQHKLVLHFVVPLISVYFICEEYFVRSYCVWNSLTYGFQNGSYLYHGKDSGHFSGCKPWSPDLHKNAFHFLHPGRVSSSMSSIF